MRLLLASVSLSAIVLLGLSACDGSTDNADAGGSGGSGEGGDPSGGGGAGGVTTPAPGVDTTVVAFDQTHIYFTGDDNKRVVDAQASFPAEGAYSQIILHLSLDCPS